MADLQPVAPAGAAPITAPLTGQPAAPAAAAAPVTPPVSDWVSSLPEAQRQFVQTKQYKDIPTMVESHQNLEKLMGAREKLIKLPDNLDSPEMGEVYDKLGRPAKMEDYTFKAPQGAELNPEFTKFAQELFHKQGLSKAQGEAIANKWNEYAAEGQKQAMVAKAATLEVEKSSLKREWGATFEDQVKACGKAAQTFGLTTADINKLEDALGYSGVMKFMAKIGSKVGEDSFVTGGNGSAFNGALTPDRAQAEIAALKQDDDFVRKYTEGNVDAKNKMTRLMTYAYPGQTSNY